MRDPKPKIHILDASEPLFAFRDLVCRCQVVIHNAEIKYMVEQDIANSMLPTMRTCAKCWDATPVGEEKRRYEYGIIEGQEERNSAA